MSMHGGPWSKERLRIVRLLRERQGREETGLQLLEGPRLVREALAARCASEVFVTTEADALTWRANAGSVPVTLIPPADLERIADTRSPQEVLATGPVPELLEAAELVRTCTRILLLDGVQDPGNCGALLRSAAAFGVEGVLFGAGSVDRSHPRLLRAAAGASFRLKMARLNSAELAGLLRVAGHVLVLPVVQGGQSIAEFRAPSRWLLVAGNEGRGTTLGDIEAQRVTIPMQAGMESLNVGAALAVVLAVLAGAPQR